MKETMAMRAPLLERLEELLDRGGTKKDVALLAVFAARYERRYRAAGAPDGIDVHDAPETPSCTQPAFRLE